MSRRIVELSRDMKDDYNYNESIKTLRTNILFCGSKVRTIMFTSSVPDEGKSDITFAAAQSMAQLGKKVLVIDADIRRSVLVSRYQLGERVNGLSQYLSGQKQLEEVVYDTNVENLSVIFAGPYSPNPAELLEEKLFTRLLEYGRNEFDYIMIDTPPMANLIDGAIVARQCDGAVLVIESGAISYRIEQRVKSQLEKSGCRILGVVLNKVESTASPITENTGNMERTASTRNTESMENTAMTGSTITGMMKERARQDQVYKENVPAGVSGKKKEGSREEVHS